MSTSSPHIDCSVNKGPGLLISCWIEASLAILVVGARLWTQRTITKRVGWDDWCMLLGLTVAICNTSFVSQSIHNGLGRHWQCLEPEQRVRATKWEYVAQPASIMSPAFSRIAFCLYLLKFTGTDKRKKHLICFFIVSQLAVNLGTLVEVLISCEHYSMLWDKSIKGRCWSPRIQAYVGFFQGAWNSTTDLILTFLPFVILKNLNMRLKTKIGLSILLGLSIIAMIACVIKTVELKALGDPIDFTMSTVDFVIWFTIEQYIVIIVASIPTLRPLMMNMSKNFTPLKSFKDFWKISDSNPSSDNRSRLGPDPAHAACSRDSNRTWRPNIIRLNSQKSYDKLEVESSYIHSPSRDPPEPGTIRKTISVYIRPATPSGEEFMPMVETVVSANGQNRVLGSRPLRPQRTRSGRDRSDRDIEMQ